MDNQHRKITGYRELNQDEVDLMNEIKALGPLLETVLLKVDLHVKLQREESEGDPDIAIRMNNATPERFLAIAKTELQNGLMHATRAVAQPEFF